jgi:hypothetical protein
LGVGHGWCRVVRVLHVSLPCPLFAGPS